MPNLPLRQAHFVIPDIHIDHPVYINGQGNTLPFFTVIYIIMMPFIVYGCVTLFMFGIIEVNIVLSVGFIVVLMCVHLSE